MKTVVVCNMTLWKHQITHISIFHILQFKIFCHLTIVSFTCAVLGFHAGALFPNRNLNVNFASSPVHNGIQKVSFVSCYLCYVTVVWLDYTSTFSPLYTLNLDVYILLFSLSAMSKSIFPYDFWVAGHFSLVLLYFLGCDHQSVNYVVDRSITQS